MAQLRTALAAAGSTVQLVADEWCNTAEDIEVFVAAGAADVIHVKVPDLGGLGNTVESLLLGPAQRPAAYCGGSATETDRSAQVTAHVAMACAADQILAKPGMGVDEGMMVVGNEMARVQALAFAAPPRAGPARSRRQRASSAVPVQERAVKIYLSSDMEGAAGVVDWSQCIGPGGGYDHYRRLLQDEVNAAIAGSGLGRATSPWSTTRTPACKPPARRAARQRPLPAGRRKPMDMMQGSTRRTTPSSSSAVTALAVTRRNGDFAEMATRVAGVERVNPLTVQLVNSGTIRLYQRFITVVLLTRGMAE